MMLEEAIRRLIEWPGVEAEDALRSHLSRLAGKPLHSPYERLVEIPSQHRKTVVERCLTELIGELAVSDRRIVDQSMTSEQGLCLRLVRQWSVSVMLNDLAQGDTLAQRGAMERLRALLIRLVNGLRHTAQNRSILVDTDYGDDLVHDVLLKLLLQIRSDRFPVLHQSDAQCIAYIKSMLRNRAINLQRRAREITHSSLARNGVGADTRHDRSRHALSLAGNLDGPDWSEHQVEQAILLLNQVVKEVCASRTADAAAQLRETWSALKALVFDPATTMDSVTDSGMEGMEDTGVQARRRWRDRFQQRCARLKKELAEALDRIHSQGRLSTAQTLFGKRALTELLNRCQR